MHLSFQKIFYVTATVIGFVAVLILAKAVIIPIVFAFLISFILFPVARKMEIWGVNNIISALLSIFGLLLIIGGGIFLFSNQILQLSKNLTDFKDRVLQVFADATLFINNHIGIFPYLEQGELLDKIKNWLSESSGTLVSLTFSGTSDLIVGLLTALVFTFLILIYRDGLVRACVRFFPSEKRKKAFNMFKSIQQVGKQYMLGMMAIILVLGLVNSFGLLIIGIDNPFLFGFLAAFLAIIPYAGTVMGAVIAVLYAFLSYDSLWMPITVAIFFWVVQFMESNFLSPKIVGANLRLNAITSILSIIIGASIWGVAGMILFLPLASMFKVVCEEYEELKPIALLIGDQNYYQEDNSEKFYEKWLRGIKGWWSG